MTNKDFMQIVKSICETTATECRSLNKAELARELMDMANIPSNAIIEEIPLDWNNQVSICFTVPNDDNYYSLYAGHWNNGTEKMMLCIIGTQIHSGSKTFFEFFTKEEDLSLDYFVKNQNEKQEEQEIETETTITAHTYVCELPDDIQSQIFKECKETFQSLAFPVDIQEQLDNVKGCKMCDLEDTINVQKYYTK